jgi:hypothetical protein
MVVEMATARKNEPRYLILIPMRGLLICALYDDDTGWVVSSLDTHG